ncbi:MucBP domain-containing protein, partial [Dellaglioa carnosa]
MSPMVSPVRANRLDQLVERADINKGLIRHSLISPIVLETKSVRSGADVTPGNFLSYFNLQGSASYNQQTGVVTLTPDVKHKVGNITLKTKINVEQSFSLSGSINIGNKSQKQSGADGIGVGFLDGDPGLVGDDGGAIGLGGLPRSFGWKADTFFNVKAERFLADPRQFQGSPNVNVSGQGNAFGAFMRADSNGIVETYDGVGNEAAQKIAEPSNNTFKDFLMEYDGQTHIMTVKYDGKIWERNIFDWETNKNYAFFLSASTGAQTNLQQFKLKEFKYDATGVAKVRYVDDSDGGTDIINAEDFEGQVGTTENIKNKLDEANAKILGLNKGYSLIGVTKSAGTNYTDDGNLTYTLDQGEIVVHYERQQASPVTAKYVDTKGNPISEEIILQGKYGEAYMTEQKNITGWVFKEVQGVANGTYNGVVQEVSYIYQREEAAPVTVNYVDTNGAKIADSDVLNGRVDDEYTTNSKVVEGWALKITPENANGKFEKTSQSVDYVYERAEAAPITVNYVDEKGNKISDPDTLPTGKVGDKYETSGKDISGWVLKETPENANGTYGTEAQTVTYVYERAEAAPITVNYVDEKGNKISDPDTLPTGKVGDKYETSGKDISGWALKETPENATGTYGTKAQTVTYVYERAEAAPITVNYVDEKGNKISDPDTLPTGKVGDKYETSGKDITGWVLKET